MASLLYEWLVLDIRGNGFALKPYDPCVANKIIRGKQMTFCWNVENLKVSHVDPKEVTNFMEWLEVIYGVLRITRGKVQKYLGVMLDLWNPGELRLTMV